MRRWLAVLVCAIGLVGAAEAAADPRIRQRCAVDGRGARCVFTNRGTSEGSACVIIHVRHMPTGDTTVSAPLCSSTLAPGASRTVMAVFADQQPRAMCLRPPRPQWTDCTVHINHPELPLPGTEWQLALVVLLTSLGVFVDARRIGARRGLLKSPFDLRWYDWGLASLLLWPIAFPVYLWKRSKIKAAVRGEDPDAPRNPPKKPPTPGLRPPGTRKSPIPKGPLSVG